MANTFNSLIKIDNKKLLTAKLPPVKLPPEDSPQQISLWVRVASNIPGGQFSREQFSVYLRN